MMGDAKMPEKLDVVIVGGGVIGCATAYYLSRRKLRVQIIERDAIGSQASGVAAGVLSPLLSAEKPGAFLDIAMAGVKLHSDLGTELKEESSLDTHYGEVSILCPAFTEAEEKDLKKEYAWQRTTGLDVAWLGPSQVAALNVGMTSEVRAAVCYPRQLQVESYRLVLAYAQAAERHGASIRQGQVVGFSHSGSRVSGVLLADGQKVPADAVLLTTGPWTTEAGSWLGCRLPVVPERGQILRLDVADINKGYAPFYGETYVLPKVDGSVLAGTTREHGVYENRVTEDGRASIVRRVSAMMPGLAGAHLVHAVSGLRPMSEDHLPMLGRLPGWDNAYVAAGHCRWGILLSALSGRCMAQLMTGTPTEYPLATFDPARFASA